MLKNKMQEYISNAITKHDAEILTLETFKEEIEYVEKHQLIGTELNEKITLIEKNPVSRFSDIYIERSDKESEELLAEENANFLEQPIDYLKKHKNEFIYLESDWFEMIGADSVSLEVDDVFGTYEVMLGLKLKKKYEGALKAQLKSELKEGAKFSLLFSQADGLWDFNFALDYVEGFNEELTIGETCSLFYSFLFKLVETVEEEKE
ncbi:branched-chain amino acid aminotransferase [Bacillus sp. FJAT-29790]|uniref:branched-chain amino acid aminotransferase n=1 Tax=Bacillus sp. FJAT-29790 TaxID=1895002 RepID=UPI001C223313|nr:branched-chain amino acid aminotransferase [Bacillus sp. FJAT-29790]MBU8878442.1 branched-chain amino acid aminotransferase [Bacillus sp. FJAT-29790]